MSDPVENLAPKIKIETDLDFFDKSNMGSIEQQETVCEKHSNNRQEGCPQCDLLRGGKTQSLYIKMEPKLEEDPKVEMEQDIDEEEDDMNVDIDTINISGYIKAEELIIKEEKHDTNSHNNPVLVEADGSVAQTISETPESQSSATHGFGLYAAVDLEKGKLLGPCEKKIKRLESTEGGSLKSVNATNETESNYMKYVNNGREDLEENLVLFQHKGDLYYRTSRDIKKGEKLFCRFQPNQTEMFKCKHCNCFVTTLTAFHESNDCTKRKANGKEPKVSKGKYGCDICKYRTNQMDLLQRHKIGKCSECDFDSNCRYKLDVHKRRHAAYYNIKFPCEVCKREFQSKRLRDGHLLSNHPDHSHLISRKIHLCPLCNYKAIRTTDINRHALTHAKGFKPFKCDNCVYETHCKYSWKMHSLTHSDTRPLSCTQCQKGFNRKDHLDLHIVNHHSDNEELVKTITHTILSCNTCKFHCMNANFFHRHLKRHKLKETNSGE